MHFLSLLLSFPSPGSYIKRSLSHHSPFSQLSGFPNFNEYIRSHHHKLATKSLLFIKHSLAVSASIIVPKMDNWNARLLCTCCGEKIRGRIISNLSIHDLCSLRQTSCALSNLATESLFAKVCVTFSSSSLLKQYRIEALGRIGYHIKHFTFSMHHSDATFLPRLLNPRTGQEINFLYTTYES